MREKDFEIMTPAGSYESLMTAIQGGTSSIYFGIERLSMRFRSSNNFTTEDLRKIVAVCNEHDIKSYLTVNTVIYGEDLPLMREIINAAKDAGVFAVIAADVATMSYANSIGQEVHLSTQLSISNVGALKFYARFADVVVLAHELNLKQVHKIYQEIVKRQIRDSKGGLIRIGMSVHGALYMAVSGRCYLSLHEMNASASRGACMQTCRRAYTVHDKDNQTEPNVGNQYIMSPRGLKTIHFTSKVMDAGACMFKLEERARGPEYVRLVTECYKGAVKAYCEGTFDEEKIAVWDKRLRRVLSRGFQDGYYLGRRLGEQSSKYGSGATRERVYVARSIRYFSGIGVAEFEMESGSLRVGDGILATSPTTGAVVRTVNEIRIDLKPVEETVKGEHFSIKIFEKIRPSDRLCRMEKVQIEKGLR